MSSYSNQITILYVEDEDDIRDGYSRALKRISKELITAPNGEVGLQKYKEFSPDVIISDIKMPIMNGIAMVKAIKDIKPDANIIFTTAHSESGYLLEAIEIQVDGYLLKPVNKRALIILVEKVAKSIVLERENEELKLELANMAYKDGLTGAFNRNKFQEVFEYEQKQSKRYSKALSIAMFDIDHFKNLNDEYGHLVGDEILVNLSKVVTAEIRDTDLFVRWGGEEFVILFNNTTYDDAIVKANKIREIVQNNNHPTAGNITISFGVTQLADDDTLNTLLQRVDLALYEAKGAGRNCVVGKI